MFASASASIHLVKQSTTMIKYLCCPGACANGPRISNPHNNNNLRGIGTCKSLDGSLKTSSCFFTYSQVFQTIVGLKQHVVKIFLANLIAPRCCHVILLCTYRRAQSVSFFPRHFKKGLFYSKYVQQLCICSLLFLLIVLQMNLTEGYLAQYTLGSRSPKRVGQY